MTLFPRSLLFFLLAAALPALCGRAEEITVFAAASLSDVLQVIGANYTRAGGERVRFDFGASSTLARQIDEGAPADLFFSADEAKMDWVQRAGLVAPGTRRSLLSNSLVIVVNRAAPAPLASPAGLAGPAVRRLALAETSSVPAGIYAKEYLQQAGLWKAVSGKVVAAENVRAALAAVASGDADAAIVYQTDALISPRVRIACEIPADQGPAISYPAAVIRGAAHAAAARRFLAYCESPAAQAVFRQFGFRPAR